MANPRFTPREDGAAAVTLAWAPVRHMGPESALLRVLGSCGLDSHIESVEGGPHLCRFVFTPRASWCGAMLTELVEYDDCARVDAMLEAMRLVFSKLSFADLEEAFALAGTRGVASLVRRVALDSMAEAEDGAGPTDPRTRG